jgi:AraC-like DNA-binding protein
MTRPDGQHLLRQFIIGLAAVELIVIAALTIMYMNYPRYSDARLLFISLTVLVYWMSYKHLEYPHLFVSGRMPVDDAATAALQVQKHSKYKHSGLKEEDGQAIAMRLQQVMTEQKLYLDIDLTLEKLASRMDVSRYVLSQVLNERFQKSYFDFVNEQRLVEAQSRLHDSKYKHYTIAAIAMDSGFNSLSRFNEYFRKNVGMTPSTFRQQALKRMTA